MAREWRFVTNHATVLFEVVLDPDARIQDIATRLGLTERTVRSVLNDLAASNYVTRTKVGRSYQYALVDDTRMRHSRLRHIPISELAALLRSDAPARMP